MPTTRERGGLFVQSPAGETLSFPLKQTEVAAKIAGNVSRVEVTQQFENPFTQPLEAIYIFPLPDEAAVDEMEVRIGDRVIRGDIKKREDAREIYEQAKQQGRTAGLLEQERDNVFAQSLANIKPGEQIEVVIRYSDSLKFEGGNYEFVFPMVVGPRFIPGTPLDGGGGGSAPAPMTQNQDTDVVPDASRLNAPILPAGTSCGHSIRVTVEIEAGVPVSKIGSPSHQVRIEEDGDRIRVHLQEWDAVPNKDFILRYRVVGKETQATVLTQIDDRGGHFAAYLIPAVEYSRDEFVPKDVAFLIDTSGSQHGDPLRKCQELMRRFINGLNPYDTFSIMDFANTTQQLSASPLGNTPQNRAEAIAYINGLQANGGTNMLQGVRAILNFPEVADGRLRSIVLLTDGYIGNENQILAEVQQHLKPGNRLYSFGAGSSVNRFLLNRIAELGRGVSRIVRHDEPTEEAAETFFRQINNPVLANIAIAWEGEGDAPQIYPTAPPDLFAEQPLILFGRKEDGIPGKLRISGTVASGNRYEKVFDLKFLDKIGNPAIAQLWGRSRIKELTNEMVQYETKAGVAAVTDTALTYQLLSKYTAFVAVSEDVRVEPGSETISTHVPVPMPEGVSYEGVFGGGWETEERARGISAPVLKSYAAASMDAMQMEVIDAAPASPKVSLAGGKKVGFVRRDRRRRAEKQLENEAQIKVVRATGLTEEAIATLQKHLSRITLPTGFDGLLVLELTLKQGRVGQVLVDEENSTCTETQVVERVARSLRTWNSSGVTGNVTLTLQIQS